MLEISNKHDCADCLPI